jgi:hypothetical protein
LLCQRILAPGQEEELMQQQQQSSLGRMAPCNFPSLAFALAGLQFDRNIFPSTNGKKGTTNGIRPRVCVPRMHSCLDLGGFFQGAWKQYHRNEKQSQMSIKFNKILYKMSVFYL